MKKYYLFTLLFIYTLNNSSAQNIWDFQSVEPLPATQNFVFPSTHRFQKIISFGDPLTDGSTLLNNNDFTGYVPISGSSTDGYLSINAETTPGGVAMLDMNYNSTTKLWVTTASQNIDFSSVFGTRRNCSGTVTPWNTVVTSEEVTYTADDNGDGYADYGWNVEIDPVTKTVLSKLWAMGNMAHENIVVHSNQRTAYQGADVSSGYLFKFVASTAGNLNAGLLYVYKGSKSGPGTWELLNNSSPADCNSTMSQAAAKSATIFNGVEDVEIGPDGKIYFAVKGESTVYRLTDSDPITGLTASVETFVGNMNYNITHANGTTSFPWGVGNDNLVFDNAGNLWVTNDGDNDYIWVVGANHTQAVPNVRIFGRTPTGAEPTGLTFSPDNKFVFLSIQHPSTGNSASQIDAAGNSVIFNKGTTIVMARSTDLGTTVPATITWDGSQSNNWATDTNWSTNLVPTSVDNVIIPTGTPNNPVVNSGTVAAVKDININAGASLTVGNGGTLTVLGFTATGITNAGTLTVASGGQLTVDGSAVTNDADGIFLSGIPASLVVNGTLNISNTEDDGIDASGTNTGGIQVGATGIINISDIGNGGVGDNGINDGTGNNNGTITITNVDGDGLNTGESQDFNNNATGTINISLATVDGIDAELLRSFNNYGLLVVNNPAGAYALNDENIKNLSSGTFRIFGRIEALNTSFDAGSTLEPGASPGKITLDGAENISGVNLNMEIDGTTAVTTYDQIEVTSGNLTLTNAVLNLSGSHAPVAGNTFTLINMVNATSQIVGTFSGLPQGANLVFNGANMTISYTGGTGNDVVLSFASPLPVELTAFNAIAIDPKSVLLTWETDVETNNKGFEIERSADGRTFKSIGFENGKGDNSSYTFKDNQPYSGINYYRLKQLDLNGQFEYSKIVSVVVAQQNNTIQVYPNPVRSLLYINATEEIQSVQLFDMVGQLKKESLSTGLFNELNVNDLAPGVYILRVQLDHHQATTQKVVIE
jgi:uncharacterized protein